MAEHSLPDGKQVIDGLAALGSALGYWVETELPIEKGKKNPQAVDVAWLSEKGQHYPLMIFEIESSISNTIANNPLKVFGKPNQAFEKPLFFFHVMIRAGGGTSRIDDLRNQYGSYNYRVYTLADGGTTPLGSDILSQHRRLTHELNLIALVRTLKAAWPEADLDSLLVQIEALGFERSTGTFAPRYAELALQDTTLKKHFIRYIRGRENSHPSLIEHDSYSTYLGNLWSSLIHLGVLSLSASGSEKPTFLRRLKIWQEESWNRLKLLCEVATKR
jgi:hypothetical protein